MPTWHQCLQPKIYRPKMASQENGFQHFTHITCPFFDRWHHGKVFNKPKILFCHMGLSCNLAKEFNGLVSKRAGCVYTRLFFLMRRPGSRLNSS
ncbi:MAG: hypothetical protein EAY75_12580 [Bacteroidetes bacterium]|nr:MAG: hypothetical protein EAY75_12580 [Bacteroidota bacterium]